MESDEYSDFDSDESSVEGNYDAVYEPSKGVYDKVPPKDTYDEVYEPSKEVPSPYILSVRIAAPLRRILVLTLLAGNFASLNGGVVFLILSWFVRNSLQQQITFLQDFYQPAAVPSALTAAGFIVLAAGIVGIKAGVSAFLLSAESASDACRAAAKELVVFCACAAAATLAILVAACICFAEVRYLSEGMGKGIMAAMHKYGNSSATKTQLDLLQLEHQCCGVDGFKDWYKVAWMDPKYLDPQTKKQPKKGHKHQDVPFSCCRLDAVRPCVSVRVEDAQYHSKYSFPRDLTLHEVGCREKVTHTLGGTVFRGVGGFVFVCFFIWVSMTLMGRYLQTSVARMALGQSPVGWLIPIKSKKGKEDEDSD